MEGDRQSLGRVFRTGREHRGNVNQGWHGREVALAKEGQDVAGIRTGSPWWWEPLSGGDAQQRDWQITKTMMDISMALKWSFMNYYVNSNKIQMLIILQPFRHRLLLAASFASWFKLCLFLHLWGTGGSPDAAGWEMDSLQLLVCIGKFSILCSQSRKNGQNMRQLLSAMFSFKLWGKLKQLLFSLISFIVSKPAGIIGLYVVFLIMKIVFLFCFYILGFLL